MHVTCVLRGTLAIARGHQTSLKSILEGSKTVNCEKKPREASLSGCFGRGRRILARECMCNVLLWVELPRLGGLRLH